VSEIQRFQEEVLENVRRLGAADDLPKKSLDWMLAVGLKGNYTYNFTWLGRPIIQYPQDMVAIQELVWAVDPDLIIETGIAHGGSLILSASMLALRDMCEAIARGETLDPRISQRRVLGIDIDIREHNRAAIEAHPMATRIEMIEGSSVSPEVIARVRAVAARHRRIMVFLDSNHTRDHVLAELEAYAPLASVGSYCVVFDTLVDEMPAEAIVNRPWGPGNGPKAAVHDYLRTHDEFEIDRTMHDKLQITVAPDGFLRRIK
jgi:cephalosporin hydroxylase